VDFFPLQVEYREKYYAAGRFPGGYFKREAKPSEREILTARVTDRPLRPFFPEGYRNDVQINNMLMSTDGENESDVLSVLASSAALVISDIPFFGPIAAVRVGRVNGQFKYNPTHSEMQGSDLNLVYAGSRDLPIMIEGNANEISEADMVAAMKFAHQAMAPLCDAQLKLRELLGLPAKQVTETPVDASLLQRARSAIGADFKAALRISGKLERQDKIAALKESLKAQMTDLTEEQFFQLFDALEIDTTRRLVLEDKVRIGGRRFDEIRPLAGQVGLLPRVHGSALFNRGETQALATVTLGTSDDSQDLDAIAGGPDQKSFILHYNFPPYSVGEVGRLGSTGRREIGHGNLAERSLYPVLPKDYPYAVRLVSEIMGSNGSSSMASVCVGTLALMDAASRSPSRWPASPSACSRGITARPNWSRTSSAPKITAATWTSKVSGTRDGITGFQVDLKIRGLAWSSVETAFAMAKTARAKILDYMATVIPTPRAELSPYAPRITVVQINPEKIGALIGPAARTSAVSPTPPARRLTSTTTARSKSSRWTRKPWTRRCARSTSSQPKRKSASSTRARSAASRNSAPSSKSCPARTASCTSPNSRTSASSRCRTSARSATSCGSSASRWTKAARSA
jgi:polyribonucleotide nucleotidyltransferase